MPSFLASFAPSRETTFFSGHPKRGTGRSGRSLTMYGWSGRSEETESIMKRLLLAAGAIGALFLTASPAAAQRHRSHTSFSISIGNGYAPYYGSYYGYDPYGYGYDPYVSYSYPAYYGRSYYDRGYYSRRYHRRHRRDWNDRYYRQNRRYWDY